MCVSKSESKKESYLRVMIKSVHQSRPIALLADDGFSEEIERMGSDRPDGLVALRTFLESEPIRFCQSGGDWKETCRLNGQ